MQLNAPILKVRVTPASGSALLRLGMRHRLPPSRRELDISSLGAEAHHPSPALRHRLLRLGIRRRKAALRVFKGMLRYPRRYGSIAEGRAL